MTKFSRLKLNNSTRKQFFTRINLSIFTILILCIVIISRKSRRPEGYDVIDIEPRKRSGSNNFLSKALDDLGNANKKAILDPRTLGIESNPEFVERCKDQQKGTKNDCRLAHILNVKPYMLDAVSKREISGSSFWYSLPYMRSCDLAERMWIKAATLVKSFSSFRGPAFDRELSAAGKEPTGYHRTWENWSGHKCHFNSTMLERAMKATSKTTGYIIMNYGRIESTDEPLILPKGAPEDSSNYDPQIHPPKESLSLTEYDLYEDMRGCAIYDDIDQGHLSLFSALCLRDTLTGPKVKSPTKNQVVSCYFGKYTGEECVHMLSTKVMKTLMKFYQKKDNQALIRMI